MLKVCAVRVAVVFCSLILGSCAVVDQFGDRVYDSNLNSQNALNQETLINVIRASKYQTMNFVAVTQVTGGQSQTLTTGLPTITFGPQQSIAQHQFPISNSLSSGATGGYQSNPLVSTTFQNAMLSPVSLRTLALLTSSHPREPVLYSLIESITLQDTKNNVIVRFLNDPTRPSTPAACDRIHKVNSEADLQLIASDCSYEGYITMLEILINAGLTSELISPATKSQTPASASSSAKGTNGATSSEKSDQLIGHICFDPTRTVPGYRVEPFCSGYEYKNNKSKAASVKTSEDKTAKENADKSTKAGRTIRKPDKSEKADASPTVTLAISADPKTKKARTLGPFTLSLTIRSPVSVYRFFGKLYGQDAGGDFRYRTGELRNLIGPDEPFINITSDSSTGCYTSIKYEGQTYCVPSNSQNTALMFTILQELRNLSIQSTDLNSAFTVRITN